MKRIFKYNLPISDPVVMMPSNAEVLSIQSQFDEPSALQLWALVEEGEPERLHPFRIYGTGHPVFDETAENYVATVITAEGQFVWHVFEAP